jgi:tRNA(Arg) A34 adenosine deaminase TadA
VDGGWDDLAPHWQAAFELMWEAYGAGALPVGAVVTDGAGAIVAGARNRIAEQHGGAVAGTRLAHAEINALSQLPATTTYPHHTIHSTLEPCLLCYGGVSMSRVGAIAYAAADPYAGACHFEIDIPVVRNAPIAVSGPLEGWPAALSQALVIATLTRMGSPYRVVELFPPEAHESARRLRGCEAEIDTGLGLAAVLPDLRRDVLA